jgi:hypothetical protein
MHAKIDKINGAVLFQLLGQHGNPVNVILGGADGTLVTIDLNGKIKVIPPEGPGDPELRKEFIPLLERFKLIGGFLPLPCSVLAQEIGALEEEISRGQIPASQLKATELELSQLRNRYAAKGCNKKPLKTL